MPYSRILKVEQECSKSISSLLAAHSLSGKVLLVSGPQTFKLYGEDLLPRLKECGKVKVEIVDSNTIAYAMSLAEYAIAADVAVIVGLGGGKVTDVAKYAAYISKLPFVSIPTTLANDGLVSPIAVLKRKDGLPKSLGAKMPEFALIDTSILEEAPVAQIKAGIGDTLSNVTALKDWRLAESRGKDEVNDYAYLMSKNAVDSLVRSGFNSICSSFIGQLANSLVLSGIAMDFAGTSRPVSGSEHCFSHALDYYSSTNNLHGMQTALGTIAMLKMMDLDCTAVASYLERFDVCVNPSALGIQESDFIYCMQNACLMRPGRYTYLDEADLSTGRLKALYEELVKEL